MNPNLSGHQFEQLKMFMTPDELIDTAHKMDSEFFSVGATKQRKSPREQWEHPSSGEAKVTGQDPFVFPRSLRQQKLDELAETPRYRSAFEGKPYETMPPVELLRLHRNQDAPFLREGHHRLALAEAKKIPYLAVTHHDLT